ASSRRGAPRSGDRRPMRVGTRGRLSLQRSSSQIQGGLGPSARIIGRPFGANGAPSSSSLYTFSMPVSAPPDQLVVAISSRALFDFEEENAVFESADDHA